MPIHNWCRVPAGLYHHFHQLWTCKICDALNAGKLPKGYSALIESSGGESHPDIVRLDRSTGLERVSEEAAYAVKANRVAIHHPLGNVVAVVGILSPGNKNSRHALGAFVEEAIGFLRQGVHLLVLDLFPPSRWDSQGIHKAIWDEFHEMPFELPADKRLTLVAYTAGTAKSAYVEPVAIGDPLPDMPLFLDPDTYVLAPLEAAYLAAWETCPEEFREAVETPAP